MQTVTSTQERKQKLSYEVFGRAFFEVFLELFLEITWHCYIKIVTLIFPERDVKQSTRSKIKKRALARTHPPAYPFCDVRSLEQNGGVDITQFFVR